MDHDAVLIDLEVALAGYLARVPADFLGSTVILFDFIDEDCPPCEG